MSDDELTISPALREPHEAQGLHRGATLLQSEADLLTPWYLPEGRFEELPGVLASTDLLAAWQPDVVAPLSGSAPEALWDAFFGEAGAPRTALLEAEPVSETEHWNPAAAASAVDCYFRFLHALERSDVAAAMRCVSPEYHVFERDVEVDHSGLRRQLESLLDHWRGPELRITPTEIPDPVFHPSGILLQTTLQVDHLDRFTGKLKTELLGYLIRFDAEPGQEWLIFTLHRIA